MSFRLEKILPKYPQKICHFKKLMMNLTMKKKSTNKKYMKMFTTSILKTRKKKTIIYIKIHLLSNI
jgi:hypothetical protein